MVELSWENFKDQVLDSGQWNWTYFEVNGEYHIYAKQNAFNVLCKINHSNSPTDKIDFDDNYKANVSSQFVDRVQSRFEMDEIVLKLARINGQADSNGDLVLDLIVPNEFGTVARYVQGGYAYTDNYDFLDKLNKIEVLDYQNYLGYGANTVLKTYHDAEVDEANQGWFFEKHFGTEGIVEIEPMGWYGQFMGDLKLRLTFKVQANARVKCLIWWGKAE